MYYLGVMSGTSCDGVDVVLVNFDDGIKTIEKHFSPYPNDLQTKLARLIANQPITIADISAIDIQLAEVYTLAIKQLLSKTQFNPSDIKAIGIHGQTVYHNPSGNHRNTLQLGSAPLVAQQTGITTIANFRQMDVAYGGEGAPLAPALHQVLFSQHMAFAEGACSVVLNLGGIANISVIGEDLVIGFDTGPANCLMDEWIKKNQGLNYDRNGEWASTGQTNQALLAELLADPYFQQPFPKSTGKEYFNLRWLTDYLDKIDLPAEDIQHTLLRLTVESIAVAIKQIDKKILQVIVCGGGSHNKLMMTELSEVIKVPIKQSEVYGIEADYVEAILMAWLAKQNMNMKHLDLTQVTGTKKPLVYGVKHIPYSAAN